MKTIDKIKDKIRARGFYIKFEADNYFTGYYEWNYADCERDDISVDVRDDESYEITCNWEELYWGGRSYNTNEFNDVDEFLRWYDDVR